MAKNLYYYPDLTTSATDERINFPIAALGLSSETYGAILNFVVNVNGKYESKFKTVKDLIDYGRSPLMGLLSSKISNYSKLSDIIQEVEDRLAKLGLKLKGSDFTVFDVRVENLNLNKQARAVLEKIKHKVKNLGDLSIVGVEKISKLMDEYNLEALISFYKELEKYGIKMEDSPYRIKPENFFPLDDYYAFLSKAKKAEIDEKFKAKTKTLLYAKHNKDFKNLSREEILACSVEDLPVSPFIKQVFDARNIQTIQELIETPYKKIRKKLTLNQFVKLENELAKLGLKFYDSDKEIENGKVLRVPKRNLTSIAPKIVDVMSLSEDEREKFLDIKILEFGFADDIAKMFLNQDKIITIRDFLSIPRNIVAEYVDKSAVDKVIVLLRKYNLAAAPSVTSSHSKYFDEKILYYANVPEEITDELKEKYKNLTLLEAGITQELIESMRAAKINFNTLGELLQYKRSDYFNHGLSGAQINGFRKVLNHYGLDIESFDNSSFWGSEGIAIPTTDDEQKALLSMPLTALGFSTRVAERLKIEGNIQTIEDLTKTKTNIIKKILKQNIPAYKSIVSTLEKYGLSLTPYSVKKQEHNGSLKVSQINHDKKELMDVYYKLLEKVQAKNNKNYIDDFSERI